MKFGKTYLEFSCSQVDTLIEWVNVTTEACESKAGSIFSASTVQDMLDSEGNKNMTIEAKILHLDLTCVSTVNPLISTCGRELVRMCKIM